MARPSAVRRITIAGKPPSTWSVPGPVLAASCWQRRKVDDKSNEITALPELLRQLAITGCVVTIDAMGCQREIAEQIVAQEADYVLALKANQPDLLEDVVDGFTLAEADASQEVCHQATQTVTKGHGRLEVRRHTVLTEPSYLSWLQKEQHWPGGAVAGAG